MDGQPEQRTRRNTTLVPDEGTGHGSELRDRDKKMLDILVDMAVQDLLGQPEGCETRVKETTK